MTKKHQIVKAKRKEDSLMLKSERPSIPKKWNYRVSVKRIKQLIYKWKNLTDEVFDELYIARKKLSQKAALRPRDTSGTFIPVDKNWTTYCEDIGHSRQVVNVWLLRKFGQKETTSQITGSTPSLPKNKYRTIVVDPPWPIQRIPRAERPNQPKDYAYQTMEVEEIQKLELPASQENCNVFLWVTHKFLPAAFECFDRWGVRYVCTFVWHKPGGFQVYQQPQRNCEFVLFGVIGKSKFRTTKNFKCCFAAKRGKHSEKPREFYETIERVSLPLRLDMFARKAHKGFKVWGLEV